MTRRRFHQPDSLDLLLDTMCNAFGGIILIALLVTLVARDIASSLSPARDSEAPLEERLRAAGSELTNVWKLNEQLLARVSDPEMADRLRLLEERRRLRERIRALEGETQSRRNQAVSAPSLTEDEFVEKLAALRREWEELNRNRAAASARFQALDEQVRHLTRETESAEQQLETLARREVRRLRLPREHSTTRKPLDVIVRYGRIYPVQVFQNGQMEQNTVTLEWRRSGGAVAVEPNAKVGLNPMADPAAWVRYLQEVPGGDYYLVFHVFEDSFAAFNRAKEAAIARGFEFSWIPLETGATLHAGGGAPPPL